MHSAVLIVTDADRVMGNIIGEAMGWGPESYTIPLSDDGGETTTHWGLRSDVTPQFMKWLKGEEPLPEGMEFAQAVIDGLIMSFSPDPALPDEPVLWGREHLDAVIAREDLAPVED